MFSPCFASAFYNNNNNNNLYFAVVGIYKIKLNIKQNSTEGAIWLPI